MWRAALVAGLVWAGVAKAATPPHRPTTITSMTGTCGRLIIEAHDLTRGCQPRVANIEYSDGQVTFIYAVGDDFTVTFSGNGRQQVHRGPETAVQPIDALYTSLMGHPSKPIRVVGSCEFSNPYNGPVAINCHAEGDAGRLDAEFTTDGRPPSNLPL